MLEGVMNDKSYVPMKAKELAMLLGIPKSQRDELTQVLAFLRVRPMGTKPDLIGTIIK